MPLPEEGHISIAKCTRHTCCSNSFFSFALDYPLATVRTTANGTLQGCNKSRRPGLAVALRKAGGNVRCANIIFIPTLPVPVLEALSSIPTKVGRQELGGYPPQTRNISMVHTRCWSTVSKRVAGAVRQDKMRLK
jgi:hypothetical protein